jgi:Tfp pilus assembly protein PilV
MQEFVRREVNNKQQGGFSLILVLVVALLSIVVGYLVKK